ncbi:MAG: hypothetical protein V4510_13065 [bacterium]
MRHTYPDHEELVTSLLTHYEEAGTDHAAGWYREARSYARALTREHGGGLGRAAGIIAALSPQISWGVNKRLAAQVMEHGWPQEGCLRLSEQRAHDIWMGDRPLAVLGGPKTRAFYRAIMGDEDAVVLDTWMATAMGWPHNAFSARQYERCERALREAAAVTSLAPSAFQAIVWTQVRGGAE